MVGLNSGVDVLSRGLNSGVDLLRDLATFRYQAFR